MPGEKIHITDLAEPVLSDLQRQVLAPAQANLVTLSSEAVLAAASPAPGHSPSTAA